MIAAIRHNLSHLFDPAGRDARPTFWWYVLFLVIVQFVLGLLASIPLLAATVGTAFDAAQSGASPDTIQASLFAEIADRMGMQIWISAAIAVLVMAMLAAAFVRRLHDGGFSGFIAIIPAAFQIIALIGSISLIDEMQAMMAAASNPAQMQSLQADMGMQWPSFAGYAAYLIVIGFGLVKSQAGANRFGEQPSAPGS